MTWQTLLAQKRVKPHKTSRRELEALRRIVDRDLADASIPGLSADRSFATAYSAVLQLAKMAIACTGHRVTGPAYHQTTLAAVRLALGPRIDLLVAYFELCRRKRNKLEYDSAEIVNEDEAQELLQKAREFRAVVQTWTRGSHPPLAR